MPTARKIPSNFPLVIEVSQDYIDVGDRTVSGNAAALCLIASFARKFDIPRNWVSVQVNKGGVEVTVNEPGSPSARYTATSPIRLGRFTNKTEQGATAYVKPTNFRLSFTKAA